MIAKEMFEKLGYEYHIENNVIDYTHKKYDYYVSFFIDGMYFTVGCENQIADVAIDTKLLQAINKQVEELGWNER